MVVVVLQVTSTRPVTGLGTWDRTPNGDPTRLSGWCCPWSPPRAARRSARARGERQCGCRPKRRRPSTSTSTFWGRKTSTWRNSSTTSPSCPGEKTFNAFWFFFSWVCQLATTQLKPDKQGGMPKWIERKLNEPYLFLSLLSKVTTLLFVRRLTSFNRKAKETIVVLIFCLLFDN